jgi:hypothetical protein
MNQAAEWLPIDINLWERDDWYISRLGNKCYWLVAPNGAEFGSFFSFEDANDAVKDMQRDCS